MSSPECGNVWRETRRRMVYRVADEDPGDTDVVDEFRCERPLGHGGDHAGKTGHLEAFWRPETDRVEVSRPTPFLSGPRLIVLGLLLFAVGTLLRMCSG